MALVIPTITLTGTNWIKVYNLLGQDRERFRDEFRSIVLKEAEGWKAVVQEGFRTGKFGSRTQPKLADTTIETRRVHKQSGAYPIVSTDQPLVATGELRDSIKVVEFEDINGDPAAFIGWTDDQMRKNPAGKGMSLARLAEILERGAKSTVITAADPRWGKMRSFLLKLDEKQGLFNVSPNQWHSITIRHKARPFLAPALNEARRGIRSRMNKEVAEMIKKLFNVPPRNPKFQGVRRTIERGRRQAFKRQEIK